MVLNQSKHSCFARSLFLVFMIFGLFFISKNSTALTVEEIIKLKEAGVSDELIEKLIEKEEREKGKIKTAIPESKTTLSIHNAYDRDPLVYRIVGETIDVTYVWEESDINYFQEHLPLFELVSTKNASRNYLIRPGKYTINYYSRNRSLDIKLRLIEKGEIKRRLTFVVREGDEIELYFNQRYGINNPFVTLNIFRNQQNILRKRLEGGL